MPQRQPQVTFPGATSIGPDPGSPTLPMPRDEGSANLMAIIGNMLGVNQPNTGPTDENSVRRAMAPLPGQKLYANKATVDSSGRPSRARQLDIPSANRSDDMLGKVYEGGGGTGLEDRVQLTGYDPTANTASFHGLDSGAKYESPLDGMWSAMKSGQLVPEGAGMEGASLPEMVKRLLQLVGK